MPRAYKPQPETVDRVNAARDRLTKSLGRTPTNVELGGELGWSRARVSKVLGAMGLPTWKSTAAKRADPDAPITAINEMERRAFFNLQRVYKIEIKRDDARTDAKLGQLAGFGGRADQAAASFRQYINATRVPSLQLLGKLARAMRADPSEMLKPIPDG